MERKCGKDVRDAKHSGSRRSSDSQGSPVCKLIRMYLKNKVRLFSFLFTRIGSSSGLLNNLSFSTCLKSISLQEPSLCVIL